MFFSEHDIQQIFLKLCPQIRRFLARRVRCQDTAADMLQDIYLRLSFLQPPPASENEVRAWMFAVASNLSIDHLRAQKRHAELLELHWGGKSEVDYTAAPERIAVAQNQLQLIEAALAELPDQCAEILFLSRMEGLSHADIAARLNISKSWVEKQLARALNHCRQAAENR